MASKALAVLRCMLFPALILGGGGCTVAPKPASDADIAKFSMSALATAQQRTQPVTSTIDFYEALARTLVYNSSIRVEEAGLSAADMKLSAASAALLPDLVTSSDYARRNWPAYAASSGSPYYSTSSDARGTTADLSLSWNILDFGLSYVRAQQAGDKALYQAQERRKAISHAVEEARVTYWRAVGLQRLQRRIASVSPDVDIVLSDSKAMVAEGRVDPLQALTSARDILSLERDYEALRNGLVGSHEQMAMLMNMPQTQRFQLKETFERPSTLRIATTFAQDLDAALQSRPEVRQALYEARIDEKEAIATLLQILPGISLDGGPSYDSNSYLYQHNWVALGAKASWNLMGLFRYPLDRAAGEAQTRLIHERALALAVTIAMQTHIARTRVAIQRVSYAKAERAWHVQREIYVRTKALCDFGKLGAQNLTRERLASVVAEAKLLIAYGEWQSAYAAYLSAIGREAFTFDRQSQLDVATVARRLREEAHAPVRPPQARVAATRTEAHVQ